VNRKKLICCVFALSCSSDDLDSEGMEVEQIYSSEELPCSLAIEDSTQNNKADLVSFT
jgi:hypothetical protein